MNTLVEWIHCQKSVVYPNSIHFLQNYESILKFLILIKCKNIPFAIQNSKSHYILL